MLRWKTFLMINIGTFILAAGYYHIHAYNGLTEGGFLGLTLIFEHLFGISPAITNLVLDIPLIIVGMYLLGRKQALTFLVGATTYSIYYGLVERFSPFTINLQDHMVFAAVLGGILVGGSLGIILKYGGGTGGDEILAILIAKATRFSIGTVFFVFDLIVLALSLVYLDLTQVAYALLTVAVSGKVLDMVYYSGTEEKKDTSQVGPVPSVTKIKEKAATVSVKPEVAAFKSTKSIQVN